jgi:hypothetical protein
VYRQYQFSENHNSPKGKNAFLPYFPYLLTDSGEICYRKSTHSTAKEFTFFVFQIRSTNRQNLSIDINKICPLFSTVFIRFGNKKFGMETLHKNPTSGGEFHDIWHNENCSQFSHLLPIGVKFSVMTLLVILLSMSDFFVKICSEKSILHSHAFM